MAEVKDEYEYFYNNKYSKVYFGDAIEIMGKRFKEGIFDLIVADPPFGIGSFEGLYNRDDSFVVDGYEEIEEDYYTFTKSWMEAAYNLLKKPSRTQNGGSMYVFSGYTNLEDVMRAARECGFEMINHIIVEKKFNAPTKNKWVSSHYHLLFYVVHPKKYDFFKPEWKTVKEREAIYHDMQDIWTMKTEYAPGKMKNVNKLPVSTIMKILKYSCPKGGRVLDPFLGNGTTAEACIKFGVQCIGIEINEKMKPIIERNIKTALSSTS